MNCFINPQSARRCATTNHWFIIYRYMRRLQTKKNAIQQEKNSVVADSLIWILEKRVSPFSIHTQFARHTTSSLSFILFDCMDDLFVPRTECSHTYWMLAARKRLDDCELMLALCIEHTMPGERNHVNNVLRIEKMTICGLLLPYAFHTNDVDVDDDDDNDQTTERSVWACGVARAHTHTTHPSIRCINFY